MKTLFIKASPNRGSTLSWIKTAPWGLLAIIGVQLVLWTFADQAAFTTLPTDNSEETLWSQYFDWGYPKHPPMPAWLLFFLSKVVGPVPWLTFLAGNLCLSATFLGIWFSAKEIFPKDISLAAVMLFMLTAYGSAFGYEYNHNLVSLPFVTGVYYFLLRLIKQPTLLVWTLLGVFSALALLSKYSAVFMLPALLVIILKFIGWHRETIKGMLIAVFSALVVMSGHLIWVVTHQFSTFRYIASRMNDQVSVWHSLAGFTGSQLARFLPAILLIVYVRHRQKNNPPLYADTNAALLKATGIAAVTPLIFMILPTLVYGTNLVSDWYYSFTVPVIILLCAYLPFPLQRHSTAVIIKVLMICQAFMLIGFILSARIARHYHLQGDFNYPPQVISQKIEEIWQQNDLVTPLVVATDTWLGEMIAQRDKGRVKVILVDAPDIAYRQWREIGAGHCVLAISNRAINAERPPLVRPLFESAEVKGEWQFNWRGKRQYFWALAPLDSLNGHPQPSCRTTSSKQ